MKALTALSLAACGIAYAEPSSSANYDIVVSTIDAGNGPSSSTDYAITQSSIGGIIGVSSSIDYSLGSGGVEAASALIPIGIDLKSYPSWAGQFFTLGDANTAEGDDFDGDGVTNEEEFLALTDPTDRNSKLELELISLDQLTNITTLNFAPFLDDSTLRVYTLLSQDETLDGTFSPTGLSPTSSAEFTDLRPITTQRFYRLRITIP